MPSSPEEPWLVPPRDEVPASSSSATIEEFPVAIVAGIVAAFVFALLIAGSVAGIFIWRSRRRRGGHAYALDGIGSSWYFRPDESWSTLSKTSSYKTIIAEGKVVDGELMGGLQLILGLLAGQKPRILRAYAIHNAQLKVGEEQRVEFVLTMPDW